MPNSTEKAASTTVPSEVPKQHHRAVDKVLKRRRQAIRLGRLAMRYNLHLADDEMLNKVLAEVSQRLLSQGQKPASPARVNPTVMKGVSSLAESTACEDAQL